MTPCESLDSLIQLWLKGRHLKNQTLQCLESLEMKMRKKGFFSSSPILFADLLTEAGKGVL